MGQVTFFAMKQTASLWETLKETFTDMVSIEITAAIMHFLFGLTALLLGRLTGLTPDLLLLINVALLSNVLSFVFVSILSLIAATQTFRRGLDPYNFVIPLVTSISNLGATLALMAALTVLGV